MPYRSIILRSALACALTLVWAVGISFQARGAEITSIVDEHGHTIFVNAADLPPAPSAKHATKKTAKLTRGSMLSLSPQASQSARALRSMSRAIPPAEISTLVEKSASEHKVDPQLVHAIIQVESAYNPRAVSRKGARGLMQLIPATALRFGVQNTFNPKQNIEGGVTYLRYLLDLFKDDVPLSVAAYNAGENAVLRNGGIPPYLETMNYVQRVTSLYSPVTQDAALRPVLAAPAAAPIYRLVDARGVVHFTNGDEM